MNLPVKINIPEGFLSEEVRCDYTVTAEMKKVWAVQLDLLNEFQTVCHKHGIRYMASGGTMLGVVRHGGYIPWDDDIDLYVRREDYDKLETVMQKELQSPYFWQTENTDRGSSRRHAQLRNSETTGILISEKESGAAFNQGIFIDIFPVDNIPDNRLSRSLFFGWLKILRKLGNVYTIVAGRQIVKGSSEKYAAKRVFKIILRPLVALTKSNNFFLKWFDKAASKYNSRSTGLMGEIVIDPGNPKTIFASGTFNNLEMRDFEFMKLPIPKTYDAFLTNQYGEWKVIKHSGTTHGDVIFDAESSYRNYLK